MSLSKPLQLLSINAAKVFNPCAGYLQYLFKQLNNGALFMAQETSKPICDFGVHKGEHYTALPASFLTWMIGTQHPESAIAQQELARREQAVQNSITTPNA